MPIICIGVSHQSAPVQLRELLALSPAPPAPGPELEEVVTLSTCNRVEVYAAGAGATAEALEDLLETWTGVPRADFGPHLYRHAGLAAAAHLCRVAAGLDSMILGEPQILGQIIRAHEAAHSNALAGASLTALFSAAVRAGKRARSETGIARNPASVSSVAANLARQWVGDLDQAQALIIGSGEMAELTIEALRSRGVRRIRVISRTLEKAQALATRWGAEAATFDSLVAAVAESQVVITSTSAPHHILTRERAEAAMSRRPHRPLVIIDIAVPRDVAPDVAEIDNVRCYNIDALVQAFAGGWGERELEVPRVEAIVAQEVAAFAAWLQAAEVTPVIAELRAKADLIRQAEVEKSLRHLSHLCESDRRRIEILTISLVNKLLHEPTLRLRAKATHGQAENYAGAVRHLFALAE